MIVLACIFGAINSGNNGEQLSFSCSFRVGKPSYCSGRCATRIGEPKERLKWLRISAALRDYELDRTAYQLRRKGRPVQLERIPLELLFLLAERRGQLVTREEIIECVWGKGVFLDTDNAINSAVRKIRRALHDDSDSPRFVATVPAKGYRFVATFGERGKSGKLGAISSPASRVRWWDASANWPRC